MPPSSLPHRRSLCLTFDAFGTLFHPRQPIATQYAAVAREHGLSGFTDEEISKRFKGGACAWLFSRNELACFPIDEGSPEQHTNTSRNSIRIMAGL